MNNKTINGIDLSKYFKNHYDSWGRFYAVEYKGNPLELQNAIKRLQEENEELKKKVKDLDKMTGIFSARLAKKYKQALEEIREMILGFDNTPIEFKTLNIPLKEEDLKTNEGKFFDFYTKLKDKIDEVLNDRD